MAKTKKTTKRAKTAAKKTTKRARTTSKKTTPKKTANVTKTTAAKKETEQKQSIRPGAIIFALLLIAIGVIGIILLQESNKLVDEINEGDEANNTIFLPSSNDEDTDAESDSQQSDEQ